MSDLVDWQRGNDRYLSDALAWLRLRLERLRPRDQIQQTVLPTALSTPKEMRQEDRALFRRFVGLPPLKSTSGANPELAVQENIDKRLADSSVLMEEAEKRDPPPALVILSQRFGLSRFERDLLLLCAAPELDSSIPELLAWTQGDSERNYPTFALAFAVFDDPAWIVVSPESQLRYWKMLEVDQSGGQPMISSQLRLDQRIVDYIKGLNYLDPLLLPLTIPLDITPDQMELTPSQKAVKDKIASYLRGLSGSQSIPTIQLIGADRYSKQLIASQVADSLGLHLYRMPADTLPANAVEMDSLVRLWERERFLLPICLYIDAPEDGASPGGEAAASLSRFLARSQGIIFLGTKEPWPGLVRSNAFEVTKPTPAEQETAWAEALRDKAGAIPALLAGQFSLDLAKIKQI
ncbi:MAG: hypothetical protein LUQ44_03500, partial [Methanothrix sp.]|nr:hypothetical protein [Methanothrix sp.]